VNLIAMRLRKTLQTSALVHTCCRPSPAWTVHQLCCGRCWRYVVRLVGQASSPYPCDPVPSSKTSHLPAIQQTCHQVLAWQLDHAHAHGSASSSEVKVLSLGTAWEDLEGAKVAHRSNRFGNCRLSTDRTQEVRQWGIPETAAAAVAAS
jgi:hypothetical protein